MGQISVTPILIARLGTVTLSGNTDIEDNCSLVHGGGGIRNGGLLQLKDNINVKSNTCAGNGSGIWNNSALEIQGIICVEDNTSRDKPLSNNVYLTAGKKITLTGALGGHIGVTSEIANAVLTSGYSTYNAGTAPEEIFFTNEGYVIRIDDREIRARLAKAVSYYDPIDKTDKTKEECLVVDSTATIWENDWYVVTGFVRIGSRVQVSGNVNLILTNGANLIVPKGIEVPLNANFTVWGQIEGYTTEYSEEDFKKAGELSTFEFVDDDMVIPDEKNAGIGAEMPGNIIVNGGKINVQGGQYAPGIGISSTYYIQATGITINNGYIWAMGGKNSAGIGGGDGGTCPPLEINDGVVIAFGAGDAAAIGGGYFGYYYPITIRGGEVYAYGSPWTAGIGMGCTDGDYTGIFASDVGGGLIDIQGGKVVANCAGHNKDHPDCGALVNSEHRIAEYGFNFHGGVQVYPAAKVTYVKDYILDVTSHPELHIVYRGTAAHFTADELAERAGIMMSSDWVFIEPCDHPGATYTVVTLLPQSGHIMHCIACDLEEKIEVHTYDRTGKCALCGWYEGETVTVTFDSDGGSAVASQTVVSGYKAVEPDDPAKDGFAFKGWYQVTGGMTAETAFDFDTAVTGDITLKAVWVTSPTFATVNLILSGKIGLSFNMCLPEINGVDYTTSWMTFTIPHGTVAERVNYADSESKESGNRAFAAYVNSIQMAEPVTATFHYLQSGVEKTVTKTCAVRDYFDGFDAAVSQGNVTDEKTIALTHAVADYGHYVQPFLAEAHQWSLGEDYATMTKHYTEAADFNMEAIKTAAADHAIVNTNQTNGDIAAVTYSLTLESETAINVYFRPAPGYRGTPTATVDGTAAEVETVGGVYCVRITGIAAHKLSDSYVIVLTTGEGRTVTVRVSALSYVNTALNYYNDTTNEFHMKARNAVAAIYAYSQAADAYKTAHPNG